MRKSCLFLFILFAFLVPFAFALPVFSAEAVQLTASITADGDPTFLIDGNVNTYLTFDANASVVVSAGGEPIAGIYLQFDKPPDEWTCTGELGAVACGTFGFLHEYVDVTAASGLRER